MGDTVKIRFSLSQVGQVSGLSKVVCGLFLLFGGEGFFLGLLGLVARRCFPKLGSRSEMLVEAFLCARHSL